MFSLFLLSLLFWQILDLFVDLLFEIILGVEHKGRIPPIGSSQEKTLIEFIKRQVGHLMGLALS